MSSDKPYSKLYTNDNNDLIKYFDNFQKKEVLLSNSDFSNGTYRIKTPGIYKLTENIVFSPNSNVFTSENCMDLKNVLDNFHPTDQQSEEYPKPPYQFGFFAAITIECDDVVIDLNNFSIEQSMMHYIHQRFFSIIELNKSPFIKTQGPSDFGDAKTNNGDFPKNICIKNGLLGRSSHHSIHGNGNKNVLLENLTIKDFEVAAIALNGSENLICRFIDIPNSLQNVPINFLFSNALYTRRFLYDLYLHNQDAHLNVNGLTNKSVKQIICELQDEMIRGVYLPLKNNKPISSELFINKKNLPEGNIYGIVVNGLGVVVNDFVLDNEKSRGNENIIIHDIKMNNITAFPREIICLCDNKGKLHVGSVGNIMPYLLIMDKNNHYKPNPMTNATVLLAKYTYPNSSFKINSKSLNIPSYMINEWFEKKEDLNVVMRDNNLKYVNLRDQMNHLMKGNIMVFISGATNVKVSNVKMTNIRNDGDACDCHQARNKDYKFIRETEGYPNYHIHYSHWNGDDISPIVVSGSENIDINNIYCDHVYSNYGECNGIKMIGTCKEINTSNISINEQDNLKYTNYITGLQNGMRNSSNKIIQYNRHYYKRSIISNSLNNIIINDYNNNYKYLEDLKKIYLDKFKSTY